MAMRLAASTSGSSSKRGLGTGDTVHDGKTERLMDPRDVYTFFFENGGEGSTRSHVNATTKLTSRLVRVGCQVAIFINKDIDFYVGRPSSKHASSSQALQLRASSYGPCSSSSVAVPSTPSSCVSSDYGSRFVGAAGNSRKRMKRATKTSSRSRRLVQAAGVTPSSSGRGARHMYDAGNRASGGVVARQRQIRRKGAGASGSQQKGNGGASVAKAHHKFLVDNGIPEIDERQVLVYLEARERLCPPRGQPSSAAGNAKFAAKHPALCVQDFLTGHPVLAQTFRPMERGRSSVPSLNKQAIATVSPFCAHRTERAAHLDGYLQLYVRRDRMAAKRLVAGAKPLNLPWWLDNMCIKKKRRLAGQSHPARTGRKRLAAGNWCECCSCSYTDLEQHCKGSQHLKFQEDGLAFADVDDFLEFLYEEKPVTSTPLASAGAAEAGAAAAPPKVPACGDEAACEECRTPPESGRSDSDHAVESSPPTKTKQMKRKKKSRVVEPHTPGSENGRRTRESGRVIKKRKLGVGGDTTSGGVAAGGEPPGSSAAPESATSTTSPLKALLGGVQSFGMALVDPIKSFKGWFSAETGKRAPVPAKRGALFGKEGKRENGGPQKEGSAQLGQRRSKRLLGLHK